MGISVLACPSFEIFASGWRIDFALLELRPAGTLRSSIVSTIVCHSPHPGHLPRYPGLIAPHCWHTQLVRVFAIYLTTNLHEVTNPARLPAIAGRHAGSSFMRESSVQSCNEIRDRWSANGPQGHIRRCESCILSTGDRSSARICRFCFRPLPTPQPLRASEGHRRPPPAPYGPTGIVLSASPRQEDLRSGSE